MTPAALIQKLIEAGTPAELVVEAARLFERFQVEAEKLAEVREQNRIRKQNQRLRHVTSRDVTGPPQTYTSPPKKDPKKDPSRSVRKIELPISFELNEADRNACADLKWPPEKVEAEFNRFRDHAAQNARRCADWHAAWRNWVRSPYQTQGKANGHVQKPGLVAACDELLDEIRSRRSAPGSPDDGSQASLFAIPGGRRG